MASPCHASLFPTPVGTSEEHRQVTGGTVDSIHREVKQRVFLQIPEVLRIRIDVRNLVRMVRGEQYPCQFVDGGLILSLDLKFIQPIERVSYHGECNLAY